MITYILCSCYHENIFAFVRLEHSACCGLYIRPVETAGEGGLGGGLQPPQILAKVDLLPINNNSEK